jgi:hypothetical protein
MPNLCEFEAFNVNRVSDLEFFFDPNRFPCLTSVRLVNFLELFEEEEMDDLVINANNTTITKLNLNHDCQTGAKIALLPLKCLKHLRLVDWSLSKDLIEFIAENMKKLETIEIDLKIYEQMKRDRDDINKNIKCRFIQ